MANFLVISGSYYPYATANAACMKEFEKELIENGHTVTYMIRQHDIDMDRVTVVDGVEIYHIPNSVNEFYATCEKLKKLPLPQPIGFLFSGSLLLIKVIMNIYSRLLYGTQRQYSKEKYLDEYAKQINNVVEKKDIDVIISVSMPFLSHEAVLRYFNEFKNQHGVKWLAYMIDAYSKNDGTCNVKEKIESEIKVMKRADKIMLLSVLKEDYDISEFAEYKAKMFYLPIPTFDLTDTLTVKNKPKAEEDILNCVFAGTLYDDIRSLVFFQKFLNVLDIKDKIRFSFMGKRYSNNQRILEEIKESGYDLTIHGVMPTAYAEEAIKNADIVLNIGNLSTNQIPSKIFQYMREGKPILTFYRIPDDPAIPYLKKYPLAYNIYEEEASLSAVKLQEALDFILSAKEKKVSKAELKQIFSDETRDSVCKRFMENIDELI